MEQATAPLLPHALTLVRVPFFVSVNPSTPATDRTVPVRESSRCLCVVLFRSSFSIAAINRCQDGTNTCAPVSGSCTFQGPGIYFCSCLPGYAGNGFSCAACDCNGHSTFCDPDTLVCANCAGNTAGDHCETCMTGYYRAGNISADCLGNSSFVFRNFFFLLCR